MKFLSTTRILLLASSAAGGLALILPNDPETLPSGTVLTVIKSKIDFFLSAWSPTEGLVRGHMAAEATTTALETGITPINAALVPDFGIAPNTNPNARQQGFCDGFAPDTNTIVDIPCACPPARADFLSALAANVAAGSVQGTAVAFSNDYADQSIETNRLRARAMLDTLQNMEAGGQRGCPEASAPNFAIQHTTGDLLASRDLLPRRPGGNDTGVGSEPRAVELEPRGELEGELEPRSNEMSQ